MSNLDITKINKYSLNKNFIMNILNNIININKINTNKSQIKQKKIIKKIIETDKFYYPDKEFNDSLLWCFLLYTEGFKNYEYSRSCIYQTENTYKIKLLSDLKKEKELLKKHKFKITVLENELIQSTEISMYTFNALLLINKVNIIYIDHIIYHENLTYSTDKICFIKKNKDRYGVWLEKQEPDIFKLKNTLICVENVNKPLKAISNYKISELRKIADKLKIATKNPETAKNYTKKELYMFLKSKF